MPEAGHTVADSWWDRPVPTHGLTSAIAGESFPNTCSTPSISRISITSRRRFTTVSSIPSACRSPDIASSGTFDRISWVAKLNSPSDRFDVTCSRGFREHSEAFRPSTWSVELRRAVTPQVPAVGVQRLHSRIINMGRLGSQATIGRARGYLRMTAR